MGLRRTAREIGLSVTGFRAFLNGSTPFESTRRKLQAWYVATAEERGETLTPELARAALELVVRPLPEAEREEAIRAILAELRRRFAAAQAPPPRWLAE